MGICYHLKLAITRLINNTYTLFTCCAIHIIIVTEKNIYEPLEVPSTYMNQLSKYVITGSSIDIQETVGQGLRITCMQLSSFQHYFVGEFGIVYHGVMTGKGGKPQAVAAKTLKGIRIILTIVGSSKS